MDDAAAMLLRGWIPPAAQPRLIPTAESPPVFATWTRQITGFCVVGAITTAVYLALYALLHPHLGEHPANILSLLLTADMNTVLNRRFSFAVGSAGRTRRTRLLGALTLLVSMALTTGVLTVLDSWFAAGSVQQLTALAAANLAGGVAHFALLRWWAFAPSSW